jgi:hypothetical protein
VTGEGVYKISGGKNGAFLVLMGLFLGFFLGVAAVAASSAVLMTVGVLGLIATALAMIGQEPIDKFSFLVTRVIGTIAGIVLTIILGGYLSVTISALFAIATFFAAISAIYYFVKAILLLTGKCFYRLGGKHLMA